MNNLQVFIGLVLGLALYDIGEHLLSFNVDIYATIDAVYWCGLALLVAGFVNKKEEKGHTK